MDDDKGNSDNLGDRDHKASNVSSRPGTYTVRGSFAFVRLVGKPSRPAGTHLDNESLIEALELKPRTYNCLTRAGLRRVADVASLTDEQLLMIPHFGNECLEDLHAQLGTFPA